MRLLVYSSGMLPQRRWRVKQGGVYFLYMNTLKSIGSVLAGFITVVVLSTGTDALLEKVGIFPPPSEMGIYITWMLVLALIYRTVYTVFGGYVTAWFAPQNPMKHVWALAILGQLGGLAGVYAGWELSAHWYPIALAVLAIPSVWLGGTIFMRSASQTL
jgi:hypothetical protein